MNREDIIRMAQEAGAERNSDFHDWSFEDETLERFAALVAAAEREACAVEAERFLTQGRSPHGRSVAAAIRARGQA